MIWERVCLANGEKKGNGSLLDYAAWISDREVCSFSTSGGIAIELSKYIIKNNGVVYGSILLNNNNIK